ncbi:MAG: sensor histidine kinase [Lachnospiraceae bacterium]|nr:sensor histidine kinase [Lachnospiraceae bacterium]
MLISTIVSVVLIAVLIAAVSYYIPLSITRPIRKLSDVTDQVARGNLEIRSDVEAGAEVGVLNDSLNAMIDKIQNLVEQVKVEQIRLRKAEFELLQAQINPHFLYNTLDAIVWLAEAGEHKRVVSMVESLSDFFRTSLNQGKELITVEEELIHVRSYLEIQQVRYQDILEYKIDVPEELYKYMISKITIQPLVENALYHGIKNKRGLGNINITGKMEDSYFELIIEDDGVGMTTERLEKVYDRIHHHTPSEDEIYGLYNVNERIRLNFGEEYGIFIDSKHMEGTVVKVRLPYNHA